VRCYILAERLHVIELKDLTCEKVEQFQSLAGRAAKTATHTAYIVTARVAGDQRAAMIFTRIGEKVPIVKSAIFPEASTGASEEAASPAPARTRTASTGDIGDTDAEVSPPALEQVPLMNLGNSLKQAAKQKTGEAKDEEDDYCSEKSCEEIAA